MEENLKELYQSSVEKVHDCLSSVNIETSSIRQGELNSLHVSAYMDIEKTIQALMVTLVYKKELASQMLNCTNERAYKDMSMCLEYGDDMIISLLGINRPKKP